MLIIIVCKMIAIIISRAGCRILKYSKTIKTGDQFEEIIDRTNFIMFF